MTLKCDNILYTVAINYSGLRFGVNSIYFWESNINILIENAFITKQNQIFGDPPKKKCQ